MQQILFPVQSRDTDDICVCIPICNETQQVLSDALSAARAASELTQKPTSITIEVEFPVLHLSENEVRNEQPHKTISLLNDSNGSSDWTIVDLPNKYSDTYSVHLCMSTDGTFQFDVNSYVYWDAADLRMSIEQFNKITKQIAA